MTPRPGFDHGRVVGRVCALLFRHVEEHGLGVVTTSDNGYLIDRDPDTVRGPDVGFVRAGRIPPGPVPGFFEGAPDLAVEVLSPHDRPGRVREKIDGWLDAGSWLVWEIDITRRIVRVHRPHQQPEVLAADDRLIGGDLLPGFVLPVSEVFKGLS